MYKLNLKGELWRQVGSDFTSTMFDFGGNFYRPLVVTAFALDYTVWGANPFGYHLTNLVLHLANTVLLYAIVLVLIPASVGWSRYLSAFVAGMFFAFRPVVSEVVIWISGRGDSLALLGMLVAVYGYLRANGRWNWWYLGAVGGFVLGLMSKEPAATLPAALVGLHIFGFVGPCANQNASVSSSWARRLTVAVKSLLPFVILLMGYFGWRWLLFGSFTQVYDTARPVELTNPTWWHPVIAALRYFITPTFAAGWDITLLSFIMLVLLILGFLLMVVSKRVRDLWGFSVVWLLSIIIPSLPQLFVNPLGEGERLLYIPAAPLAILFTTGLLWMPSVKLIDTKTRIIQGTHLLYGVLLIGSLLVFSAWEYNRLLEWKSVSNQMDTLVRAVREEAATVTEGQTTLLIAPTSISGVFFARNGQSALMSLPIQPQPLYGPLFVYAPERPCQPPTIDLEMPITKVKCWNIQKQQFEPFDPSTYDRSDYPRFWLLDPAKDTWLNNTPQN